MKRFLLVMLLICSTVHADIFTQDPPTKEERIQAAKQNIIALNNQAKESLIKLHALAFEQVWNPGEDITPQEIFDSFGNEACNLFDVSSKTQNFSAEISDDYVPLEPPYNYTINEDCTVTVGAKKESEILQ